MAGITPISEQSESQNLTPQISQSHFINQSNQSITIRLSDTNYLVWRQQVLSNTRGYGLEGFLLGTIPKPPEFFEATDPATGRPTQGPPNGEHVLWVRQDQLLASWLLASMSETVLVNMVGFETSSEIWDSLEKSFASQSPARIMQYKLQLQTLKKGSLTMREYLTKMKSYADVLASAGHKLTEDDQILHILSGLGHEYDPVVVPITSRSESFPLKDVAALILSFETRLDPACDPIAPSAHFASQVQSQAPKIPSFQ